MPITSSAKKALRASSHKRVYNLRRQEGMKDAIVKLKKFIASGNKEEAKKLFSTVQKMIDKGAKRGIIKTNTAARKKSRLVAAIKKIS